MEKLKMYGSLLFSLLGAFLLGVYTVNVIEELKHVQPYQWALTSLFTVFFMVIYTEKVKENK